MKKLLSMLLVLTMVVTTLMGVMVIDVNAATDDGVTKATFTNNGATVTLPFGSKQLPTSGLNAMNGFVLGDWYAHGYTYSEADIDAFYAGTATTISGTATPAVHFLSASVVEHPLADNVIKYDFKPVTFTDGINAAKDYAVGAGKTWFGADGLVTTDADHKANYSRISVFPLIDTEISQQDNLGDNTYSFAKIAKADAIATKENSTAYVLSFYAYTQNVGAGVGESILFDVRSTSSTGLPIYGSDMVSTKGVPHKVDIVLSSNGSTLYSHYYVDGVEMHKGVSKAITGDVTFQPRFNIQGMISGNTETVSDTDWYLPYYTKATTFKAVSQADLNSELIAVPYFNATTQATEFRTDDYITGVIASLDASIKGVLETTTVGDKIVDIAESKYNNPVSLFDTTVENATVKLVSRTTGEEVAPASATGTMDDYYFMVNGIYIIPNKVADPAPYVNLNKNPFQVAEHNKIDVRMLREDYEKNSIPADEPAYGGLRTGFVRYTNEPRGSFYFSSGKAYYNEAGYYNVSMPGMVKRSTYVSYDFEKNMTTLQFDMYIPEYTYKTSGESVRIALSGYRNDASTSNKNTRTGLPGFTLTTNGKVSGSAPANSVDLVGNAWNTVSIQFDATNTPTSGNVDIIVYVNGEKQLEMASTTGNYGATAKNYISFIEYVRLYMPSYSSVGIMNDGWYVGDFVPGVTATTENAIDTANISGATVSVDNVNNLIVYDSSEDKNYEKLIAAMEAAGYNAVYERVVDKELVDKKYSEVDGDVTINGLTVTGAAVKRWIELPATDAYITYTPDSDADGKNEYTIVATDKIKSAGDNGDGTATLVALEALTDMTVYDGVVHKANEIINMLIEEGNTAAATQTLVGFTAVNEAGKLPRIYTLQEMGTDLYTLAYDEATKVATLNYREFGGTDNIPFVMVVGAYDAKGKLLALDVSEAMAIDSANEADGVKTKTFTADFGELDLTTVRKYKVFAFNSFAERKPIIANYSMINPAYVAPVE